MKRVLTYGTFDLLHIGHVRLFERARALGDHLIVAVSTDEFNAGKGKSAVMSFEERCALVASLKCVDQVIAERCWEQKPDDIRRHKVDIFVMGGDWEGKFDDLRDHCEVQYIPRTEGVSSTSVKERMALARA